MLAIGSTDVGFQKHHRGPLVRERVLQELHTLLRKLDLLQELCPRVWVQAQLEVRRSEVRIQVLSEGYDPTIGYLHSYKADRPAFVLDLMEPMRPIVDRAVLHFVQAHTFHPADFAIRRDGVCRLIPAMTNHIITMVEVRESGILSLVNIEARGSRPVKT